jgi:hypothetical protein
VNACVGEPVSWLRLERFALGELEGAAAQSVSEHVATCPACRGCLEQIGPIDLPPVRVPAPAAARPWWSWPRLAWAGALLTAAAVLVLILAGRRDGAPAVAERHVRVKGGELTVSVVRERAGLVDLDATTFRTGDRLKLRITCTPAAVGVPLHAEVVVFQGGASFPVPPAHLFCDNDVTLPGAFRITDAAPATVCLAIGEHPPDRTAIARRGPHGPGLGCVPLTAEDSRP